MKKKKRASHPLEASYSNLLDKGEILEEKSDVGVYAVLFTNKRVLLKKKVSHSLITFNYKEVEVAEYVTFIHWVYVIIAAILFTFAYSFILLTPEGSSMTIKIVGNEIITTQGGIAQTPLYYHLFGIACAVMGFWFLFHFILSLFGMLRIELVGDKKDIEIRSKWNEDIPRVLSLLDSRH